MAHVSLTNEGTIAVNANAHATGTGVANASALVRAGVHRSPTAMDHGRDRRGYDLLVAGATANFVNDATLEVGAAAYASGTSARARATASYAAWQEVSGPVASAYMTNNATLALVATANASGVAYASAVAEANTAIIRKRTGLRSLRSCRMRAP